jgi:hypothetical protein
MISPAEFWGSIRPSGMTAEAELVELWERLRDCNRAGGGAGMPHRPHRRSRAGRDDDFDHDKPRRLRAKAREAARRALADAEARALAEIALRPPSERAAAQQRLAAILAGDETGPPGAVPGPETALFGENGPERAVLEAKRALEAFAEDVQEIIESDRRGQDNRRRALILAALLALDA